MAKKRRLYKTILGIPIWTIVAISIFLIVSIIYDLGVGDRNIIRYCILGAATLILIISILVNAVSIKDLKSMLGRQMGA